jgi:hypothetical protein
MNMIRLLVGIAWTMCTSFFTPRSKCNSRQMFEILFTGGRARAKGWRALLHIPGGGGTLGGGGGSGGLGISAPLLGGGLGEAGALLSTLKSPLLTGGGIITGLVGLVEGGGSLDGLLGLLSLLSIATDRGG